MRKGNWTNGMKTLRFLGFAFSFVCVIMLIVYFFHFNGKFAEKSADWANFGSYFGSITGLMAFLAVLFSAIQSEKRANKAERKAFLAEIEAKETVRLARLESDKREAKATEQAVKREERDIFFKLLELHREKASAVIFYEEDKEHKGISSFEMYVNVANNLLMDYSFNYCIVNLKIEDIESVKLGSYSSIVLNELKTRYLLISKQLEDSKNLITVQEYVDKYFKNTILYRKFNTNKDDSKKFSGIYKQLNITFEIEEMFEALRLIGSILNVKFGYLIGQYFRNMFYMLQTINKFNYDKEYYFKLYRAQLSRNEILICLLNSVSFKSSSEFVKLLKDNNILNDLFYKDLFLTQFQNDWQKRELIFIEGIFECYLKKVNEKRNTNLL